MSEILRWGKQKIKRKFGTEHFLVVGASGSGKTTLIKSLLRSVFEEAPPFRAMVYDPKQEMLPYLYALAGTEPSRIKVLDPFDRRAAAWNLVQDIDGPVSARQFATILIPDVKSGSGADSFFINAVRDLLTGVILTFINCVPAERAWTFRDVILTMLYEPYLRFMLGLSRTRQGEPFPINSRLSDTYLAGDSGGAAGSVAKAASRKADPRTASNIRATINAALAIYEPVAAVWDLAQTAGHTFSLSEWVQEGCCDILVLGNDEASRAAIDAINRAIFKRSTELLLANRETTQEEKDTGNNQTWFLLDEVREAGELDGLSRLLTKGRSKGACVVLGFQDIDGMRHAYGKEVAQEICGQCSNIAILKLNSPSTAEWATELFGSRLAASWNRSVGVNTGSGPHQSQGEGEDKRPWVYTSDLLYLPTPSPENGLHGYFRGPGIDPAQHALHVHIDQPYLPEIHPDVARQAAVGQASVFSARLLRPVTEHYLKPWDQEDWQRLGLPGAPPLLEQPELTEAEATIAEEQRREALGLNAIHTALTVMIEQAARRSRRGESASQGAEASQGASGAKSGAESIGGESISGTQGSGLRNSRAQPGGRFASDTMRPVNSMEAEE